MYMFWVALLLGVVEGLTEFLPVSSTGHLIVTNELLGFTGLRAEVYSISDLVEHGSETAIKAAGKMRTEGRDYGLQAEDVCHFLIGK